MRGSFYKEINVKIYLENGAVFGGKAFGYFKKGIELVGDIAVHTGITGYQEVISDPAYAGKLLCMTTPLIGSYGINLEDMESSKPHISALIVRHKSDYPNNWRCEMTLDGYLKQTKVLGIEEIDPRALTKIARQEGPMRALISTEELTYEQVVEKIRTHKTENLVEKVTTKEKYAFEGKGIKSLHIGVLDLGVKSSLLKSLQRRGVKLTVFPANTSMDEILSNNIDGLFITGGPGSPDDIADVIQTVAELVQKKPIVGTGLGHLVLAKALGCTVERMKFGHHGGNYSVKSKADGRAYITSQGHDYVVTKCSQDVVPSYVNTNDGSIEGIRHRNLQASSVAWNITGSPGPDTDFVIDDFLRMIEDGRLFYA